MTSSGTDLASDMRLAVLRGPRRFVVEQAPVPDIDPDEVLVRVAASGVCSSELEPWLGADTVTYPLTPGHEVSGVVVAVGAEVADLSVGAHVGVWVTSHGFAEYVAVRASYCRTVQGVPLDLVLTEPLACAANAVELADVRLGDDVVIIGAGFMGALVQQLVMLRGPRSVVVADTRADARALADRLGATRTVDPARASVVDAVAEITGSGGADVTFECTGSQQALDGVGDVTRMSGTIVLVGFHQGGNRTIPLSFWNWMAFRIANAHFRDLSTILRGMTIAARLQEAGKVRLDDLVTHRFDLDDINEAFAAAVDKPAGYVKAVVSFDDTR